MPTSAQHPLVDVGIPAHGEPVFLAEAIESVLGQTYRELRLVVLDDSEGEAIERVVAPYLVDRRLDYRKVSSMSATQAMTTLIEAGDGAYFAFLHDDDRWEPEFLRRRVDFLEAHSHCGLVFSGHIDIDDQSRETARFPAPYPEGIVPREQLVPEMQRRNVIDVMHCVLTRRTALEGAGPWLNHDHGRVFDWELWLRLVLRFEVGCLDVEDAHYRAHDAQISSQPGRAKDFRALLDHADRLTAELAPGLRLSEAERLRQRAGLELSETLDWLQAGDGAAARAALRKAWRIDGGIARDRRFGLALLGSWGGPPGRALVVRLRNGRWQRLQDARRAA